MRFPEAIQEEKTITPAAEWLVDNFHIVDEQVREIIDDLPSGYYTKLPKLASGHLQGYPRVLGVAWAFVAHTDSRFDPDALRRFISAYQRIQPLTIGELWAVAISLRVVLVENLRRLAMRIVQSRDARQEADALADRLLGADEQSFAAAVTVLQRSEKAAYADGVCGCNSSNGCAIWIPKSGRSCSGSTDVWPKWAPQRTTSYEPNISNRAPPAYLYATSSPACD